MLGSILIGLNAPAHGHVLQELGIRWARRTGATLVGLGIVDEPGIRAIEPVWPVGGNPAHDPVYYMGYEARMADVTGKVQLFLEQFAARCDAAGVPHVELRRIGSPSELIEHESQACDLILLARRSNFRFISKDDEHDETLKKVSKSATRPLVVVSGPCPEGPVIVASDGRGQAARALTAFVATGLAESGQIYVVSVSMIHNVAANRTERAVQFLKYHKLEAIPITIDSDAEPASVILEEANRVGAGLLVMGAHGQPVLRDIFFGSVTRTVLGETTIPLFLSH